MIRRRSNRLLKRTASSLVMTTSCGISEIGRGGVEDAHLQLGNLQVDGHLYQLTLFPAAAVKK